MLFASVPRLRTRLVLYGARSGLQDPTNDPLKPAPPVVTPGSLLDRIASLKVPHGWFLHFYLVSCASSIFWAYQILTTGHALRWIGIHAAREPASEPMAADRMAVAWLFMAAQGLRRLIESVRFQKRSKSSMFVVHWILGLCFYITMGVAVWIEGAGEPSDSPPVEISMSEPRLHGRHLDGNRVDSYQEP